MGRLRDLFLGGTAGQGDYWRRATDLAAYDATFAQRIGWKWDHVLGELARLGWTPPKQPLLDWGCGSGIASRAFLDHFGPDAVTGLWLWDRSSLAANFARAKARRKYAKLEVNFGQPERPGIVLVSHVLGELTAEQAEALARYCQRAECVLWVEPGAFEASLALIEVRERLRRTFNLVAPCPHHAACGLLAPGNERHWCHHFAAPPAGVFTDPHWGRFARLMGIDLRSLPVSYLVLDQRPVARPPAGTVRVLGRPRVYKAHARVFACEATGVGDFDLFKRDLPDVFRALNKGDFASLQVWSRDGKRIVGLEAPSLPSAVSPDQTGLAREASA